MKYCSKCGNPLDPEKNFCSKCGARIVPKPQPVQIQPHYAPQPQYVPQPQPTPPVSTELPCKGLGIAGMIMGIVAAALTFFAYIPFLALLSIFTLPLGIAGIILSAIALSKARAVGRMNGMALAGLICSAVTVGLFVIGFTIGCVLGMAFAL